MSSHRHRTALPAADHTPAAALDEGALRGVVGYQLAQAAVVANRVFDEQVGRPTGMRRLEFSLLALLHANPRATARQLAGALAVTPPNIAVAVDRLAQAGLLTRERSSHDARMQHLTLTTQGDAAVSHAVAALQQAETEALAGLSPAERAMLAELLHKAARRRRG